ncbi:hypothetical protein BSLA_02f0801 [Burkholderia stabilis]|nr:hypothetical protein BSLA_02f0801 [Burkholderia stabilis]
MTHAGAGHVGRGGMLPLFLGLLACAAVRSDSIWPFARTCAHGA